MHVMIDSPYYTVFEMTGDKEGDKGGIEILDKTNRKEVFLMGQTADIFRLEVERLAATEPSLADVEEFLDNYRHWMHNSVSIH